MTSKVRPLSGFVGTEGAAPGLISVTYGPFSRRVHSPQTVTSSASVSPNLPIPRAAVVALDGYCEHAQMSLAAGTKGGPRLQMNTLTPLLLQPTSPAGRRHRPGRPLPPRRPPFPVRWLTRVQSDTSVAHPRRHARQQSTNADVVTPSALAWDGRCSVHSHNSARPHGIEHHGPGDVPRVIGIVSRPRRRASKAISTECRGSISTKIASMRFRTDEPDHSTGQLLRLGRNATGRHPGCRRRPHPRCR